MRTPDNESIASYLSLAPDTTALFFELHSEMQGPVLSLCAALGRQFPGRRISMTAAFSYRMMDLQMVVGVSAPLTPENAVIVDQLMQEYFQPVMDRISSKQLVVVALGENLGEHSARHSYDKPVEALAGIERARDKLIDAGPLGGLLATSMPLYEQGHGDDLARLFKVVSSHTHQVPN
jgi:hypothetical protein